MNNYEDLMLSLADEVQKKEDKKIKEAIKKIKNESKEKKVLSSEKSDYTNERMVFSCMLLENYVSNYKMNETRINGKMYVDCNGGLYVIRIPQGEDRWTIYKNRKLFFRVEMKSKNKYEFRINKENLKRINVDEEVALRIKKTIHIKNKKFGLLNVEFNVNYDDALLILEDLRSLSSGKRNNILD